MCWYDVVTLVGVIVALVTGALSLFKPFRDWITGKKKERAAEEAEKEENKETDRCLLRGRIADIYYEYRETKTIPQYKYEEVEHLVNQYHKLHGNSFINRIWDEMQQWEIIG